MKIQLNETYQPKEGSIWKKSKVVEIFTNTVVLYCEHWNSEDTDISTTDILTKKEFENNFIIPKEKWVPEINEVYFLTMVNGTQDWFLWKNDRRDNSFLAMNNVFKTSEEERAHAEKWRNVK